MHNLLIQIFGLSIKLWKNSRYRCMERFKKTLLNTHRITKEILEAYSVDINDLNKEQQNILDEWEANKIESCERGTKIHSQLEHSFII